MGKATFENLEVYQLAEKLADEVWSIVVEWEYFAKSTIGTQIVDSSDSVCANIAEGCGRFNYKDNARFVKVARGSLYETKNWLRRAFIRGLLTEKQTETIKPMLEELLPKLNAYKRLLDNSAKRNN
jgi:four helix bundle protein